MPDPFFLGAGGGSGGQSPLFFLKALFQQLQHFADHFSLVGQLRTVGLSTSANEKVARLFLDWSSEEAQTSEGAQIKMALTHEQIAECVGSTRETITRTLSEFKNKHLVTFKGATVTIPSRSALQAVCGD